MVRDPGGRRLWSRAPCLDHYVGVWGGDAALAERTRRRRGWWSGALVAAVAVVVTGCLDGDVGLTVGDDGGGEVVAELLLDPPAFALLSELDLASLVDARFNQTGAAQFERVERDGMEGFRVSVPFEDYRDLESAMVGGAELLGVRVQPFTSFDLQRSETDSSWALEAVVLPLGDVLADAAGDGLPAGLDALRAAAEGGIGGTELTLSISLPGEVTASNADDVSGGTARWQLEQFRSPATLRMETEPPTFPTPVHLVLGGAAVAVAAGVVLSLWGATSRARSRRRGQLRRRRRGKGSPSRSAWGPPAEVAPTTGSTGGPGQRGVLPPLSGSGADADAGSDTAR